MAKIRTIWGMARFRHGTTDRRFLSADERGSIVSVTDGSGALVAINSYDEYGIPAATNHGRFQYSEHRSHAGGMARSGG